MRSPEAVAFHKIRLSHSIAYTTCCIVKEHEMHDYNARVSAQTSRQRV